MSSAEAVFLLRFLIRGNHDERTGFASWRRSWNFSLQSRVPNGARFPSGLPPGKKERMEKERWKEKYSAFYFPGQRRP
jgi:hypothetical protein